MLPAFDPSKVEKLLKQLGIKTEEINATQVIIKTSEGEIKIDNPKVVKTVIKGQVIYQVTGSEEFEFPEDDIKLVMEESGCKDREKVIKALKETKGDIVEAILKLKEGS